MARRVGRQAWGTPDGRSFFHSQQLHRVGILVWLSRVTSAATFDVGARGIWLAVRARIDGINPDLAAAADRLVGRHRLGQRGCAGWWMATATAERKCKRK